MLNTAILPYMLRHFPAGTSTKTFAHLMQQLKSRKFAMYDYGSPSKNSRVYGQFEPPEYNVSMVSVPVATYWGRNDWFSNEKVRLLIRL